MHFVQVIRWTMSIMCTIATFTHITNAWGRQGHLLIGEATYQLMDENTQEIVRALAFNHSLALTSPQADIIKHTKQYAWTRHLHYYDNPNSDPPEYCSLSSPPKDDHDNLLYAIKNFTINFESRPKFHLLMLVHLLQDLHQPLHLSGKSRGGNGVMITLPNSRRQVSLHEYWDTNVIHQAQSETNGKLLEYVTTAARYMTCDKNSPERWARETERINCELVWTDPTDPSYHERATNVAIHLLIRASIRTKCYLTDVLSKKKWHNTLEHLLIWQNLLKKTR